MKERWMGHRQTDRVHAHQWKRTAEGKNYTAGEFRSSQREIIHSHVPRKCLNKLKKGHFECVCACANVRKRSQWLKRSRHMWLWIDLERIKKGTEIPMDVRRQKKSFFSCKSFNFGAIFHPFGWPVFNVATINEYRLHNCRGNKECCNAVKVETKRCSNN